MAAYRLLSALEKNSGVQARLVYLHGSAGERFAGVDIYADTGWKKKFALAKLGWEKLCFAFHEKSREERFRFSTAQTGYDVSRFRQVQDADIIHLHWINHGFVSLDDLLKLERLNKPIVWTMHDMWAMTGGCHHSRHCEFYQGECGNCFYLKHPSDNDLSHKIHLKKQKIYNKLDITFIACSNWLAQRGQKSLLLSDKKIRVIPNPIDTEVYKPADKALAKQKFGIPADAVCVSFVAANVSDVRKGFEYLRKALWQLKDNMPLLQNKIKLLVMGAAKRDVNMELPFEYSFTGYLNDEARIVDFYNASDVFVLPSLEENLPNTIMEALTCAVPSVAFNVGGIPDLIHHKENGYLAAYESIEDLSAGIQYVLTESQNNRRLQENARSKALESYSYPEIAKRVHTLYNEVLKK